MEIGGLQITDFQEFKERLAKGKELLGTTYYTSTDRETPRRSLRFFDFLSGVGYDVKTKPLLKEKGPKSEIDPLIAVDICRCAVNKNISDIILVSGDHHFVEAVIFAKEKKKKVIVVSTPPFLSEELKKVSDEWFDLKEIITGITRKSLIEEKREEALEKLKAGRRIILPELRESN